MSQFNNSLSTSTDLRWGSNVLKNVFYLAQSFNIPGLSFSNPQLGSRGGVREILGGDTVEFSTLNLDIMIDREWNVYDEVFNNFIESINVKKGKFSNKKSFDVWLEVYDSLNKKSIKKFWFRDCRVQSIGDIEMDIRDGEDSSITVLISLEFNYMEMEN